MCNTCIHKIVCSKYIACGVRKCKHYKHYMTGIKERWLWDSHKVDCKGNVIAQCPRCKSASLIWFGISVGIPDDIPRQAELINSCAHCGADMRGNENG